MVSKAVKQGYSTPSTSNRPVPKKTQVKSVKKLPSNVKNPKILGQK